MQSKVQMYGYHFKRISWLICRLSLVLVGGALFFLWLQHSRHRAAHQITISLQSIPHLQSGSYLSMGSSDSLTPKPVHPSSAVAIQSPIPPVLVEIADAQTAQKVSSPVTVSFPVVSSPVVSAALERAKPSTKGSDPAPSTPKAKPSAATTAVSSFVLHHTSPVFNPENKKQMAIILSGLGLQEHVLNKIVEELDPAITLAFYPYTHNMTTQMLEARRRGHELLVLIPMEPMDYPNVDPGPNTLLTGLSPKENIDRLNTLLGNLSGYVGVMNAEGSRFTASLADYEPIIKEFYHRGLLLVDHFAAPRSLSRKLGAKYQLPVVHVESFLDPTLGREGLLTQLDHLIQIADQRGSIVVVAQAYPIIVDVLKEWCIQLKDKPIVLVPISAVALPKMLTADAPSS
jgi:hypothetical protein